MRGCVGHTLEFAVWWAVEEPSHLRCEVFLGGQEGPRRYDWKEIFDCRVVRGCSLLQNLSLGCVVGIQVLTPPTPTQLVAFIGQSAVVRRSWN